MTIHNKPHISSYRGDISEMTLCMEAIKPTAVMALHPELHKQVQAAIAEKGLGDNWKLFVLPADSQLRRVGAVEDPTQSIVVYPGLKKLVIGAKALEFGEELTRALDLALNMYGKDKPKGRETVGVNTERMARNEAIIAAMTRE